MRVVAPTLTASGGALVVWGIVTHAPLMVVSGMVAVAAGIAAGW